MIYNYAAMKWKGTAIGVDIPHLYPALLHIRRTTGYKTGRIAMNCYGVDYNFKFCS